jgi:hypothetical protein
MRVMAIIVEDTATINRQTPVELRRARWLWALRALAVLAGVIALARVASTIGTFNNTVDEPYNISAAVGLYDVHKLVSGIEQPPVARLVAAIPLYLSGVHLRAADRRTTVVGSLETYAQGDDELFHSAVPPEVILHRVRLVMLVFPVLALLYLCSLGRWLVGEIPTLWAVVFFSNDPTFLGHAMWICTDMASCAAYLAAAYYGMRWILYRGSGRAACAGVAVALAFSAKFSCIIIVPAMAALMVLRPIPHMIATRKWNWKMLFVRWPRLWEIAIFAVVAFFAVWATYLFNIGTLGDQTAFAADAVQLHATSKAMPHWLESIPIPMPSLLLGLRTLIRHMHGGHLAFLNGQFRTRGWWYYFPEALLLKSPLAFLAGLLIAGVLLFKRPRPQLITAMALLLPPALFMASAMKGRVDIGIRHILPVIPFLYLIISAQLVRTRLTPVLMMLICVAYVETAATHPDYASYFNIAAGGEAAGGRYLSDSNVDWGQYVRRLSIWLHKPEQLGKPYTTRLLLLPVDPIMREYQLDPQAESRRPGGLFCISQVEEQGLPAKSYENPYAPAVAKDYSWLKPYPIVARIGAVDVYDLMAPPQGQQAR